MKKRVFCSELSYLCALFLLPLGIVCLQKADLGMSSLATPAYLLSMKFNFLTFGMAEYCLQAVVLLIMYLLIRKFRVNYLFSFITAFFHGNILDLYLSLAEGINPGFAARLCLFVVGAALIALAVSFYFHTYIFPGVYEMFVKEIALHFHIEMGKFKIVFDCSFFLLGVGMSFLFFKELRAISWGTLVCALVLGLIIGVFSRWIDKRFDFKDKLPLRKFFEKR